MISVENLDKFSEQEVFDFVVKHLLTQNESSLLEGGCAYRGDNGLKCAAGCLIPDELYNSSIEGNTWGVLLNNRNIFPDSAKHHETLIEGLQLIHDGYNSEDWERELRNMAKMYNLNFNYENENSNI